MHDATSWTVGFRLVVKHGVQHTGTFSLRQKFDFEWNYAKEKQGPLEVAAKQVGCK